MLLRRPLSKYVEAAASVLGISLATVGQRYELSDQAWHGRLKKVGAILGQCTEAVRGDATIQGIALMTSTKQQSFIAQSSAEAELFGGHRATMAALCIKNCLAEISAV
eukprot:5554201-Amphidinium_carterae.1